MIVTSLSCKLHDWNFVNLQFQKEEFGYIVSYKIEIFLNSKLKDANLLSYKLQDRNFIKLQVERQKRY